VDVTRIDGGNAGLRADNRRVMRLGATLRPIEDSDLSLSLNYVRNTIENPIASFPTATPEIEAAFPERFARDAEGRLVSIDSRPVNFERSEREEIRTGLNYSKAFGPEGPPPGAGRRGAGAGGEAATGQPRPRREGGGAGGAPGGGGRGGFGGGGFGGGGGNQTRLQLSLYHTYRIADEILIRDGVPVLDLLEGSATGSRGGQPRHELEAQAGLFRRGLGVRVDARWRAETFVRGGLASGPGGGSDLFFSDQTTVNLRLFADLAQQRDLVRRYPWLRGSRVSLAVNTLFDSGLEVTDAAGLTPFSYQPAFLDPVGRSVRLSFRKLFFTPPQRRSRAPGSAGGGPQPDAARPAAPPPLPSAAP
jgi:hypothetical protein